MATKLAAVGPTATRTATRIRELRQQRRLTLAELAARLTRLGRPILVSGLSKIEQSQRRIDADDLVALALALDVTPNHILLPAAADAAETTLTPATTMTAAAAWDWAAGTRPPAADTVTATRVQALEDRVTRLERERGTTP